MRENVEDLLYIPGFLRRVDWTKEQHQRADDEYALFEAQRRLEQAREIKRHTEKAENERCEREAALEARQQRKLQRGQAKERSQAKKQERSIIIDLIDRKIDTHGKIVKASNIDGTRLSNHLRYLLNHNRIRKATPRRYVSI